MNPQITDAAAAGEPQPGSAGLLQELAALRGPLQPPSDAPGHASPGEWLRQGPLLRLELSYKLEEQLLLPALAEHLPPDDPGLRRAGREIGLLRDLGLLAEETEQAAGRAGSRHELLAGVLQGLAAMHFDAVDALLRAPAARALDWAGLHAEVRAWLERWHGEMQADGEVEDEERDPVGLPPR